MRCAKTNIMCFGGHLMFEDYKIYLKFKDEVREIRNANFIKEVSKNEKIKLVAIPRNLNIKVGKENFDSINEDKVKGIKIRYTSSRKAMGQNHLDLPESESERIERRRRARELILKFPKGDRDLEEVALHKLSKAFEEVGFIDCYEKVNKAIIENEINSLRSLSIFIDNTKTMRMELGITKEYSKSFSSLEKLNYQPGGTPALYLSSNENLVEDHAVLRFFERIVPRIERKHIQVAREYFTLTSSKEKQKHLGHVKRVLETSGISKESIKDCKKLLAELITDDLNKELNRNDRFKFSSRNTTSSKDNRFILKVNIPYGDQIEVVCELLDKVSGSKAYNVKIVSLWIPEQRGNYRFEEESQHNIDTSSIWYFDGLAKNDQYEFARITEKILIEALK